MQDCIAGTVLVYCERDSATVNAPVFRRAAQRAVGGQGQVRPRFPAISGEREVVQYAITRAVLIDPENGSGTTPAPRSCCPVQNSIDIHQACPRRLPISAT